MREGAYALKAQLSRIYVGRASACRFSRASCATLAAPRKSDRLKPVLLIHQPASYIFAQDDGLGNFLHGFAPLAALALDGEIGFLFGDLEFALENPLSAFDELARFELFREVHVFTFQTGHLDFRSHQKSDGGDQHDLALRIFMWLAILQIDYSDDSTAAHHGHG